MTKINFMGRFDLDQIDGWLDDEYLDDHVGEDAWIEIAQNGSGCFRIGDVEGVLVAVSHTEDSIRWRWSAEWIDQGLAGTGSASFIPEKGLLLGSLNCQGEEQPWGFSGKRTSQPTESLA